MTKFSFLFAIMAWFSFGCLAENLKCIAHSDWPEERSFTATINVEKSTVTVSDLKLSEDWPLPEPCDSPLGQETTTYKRNIHIKEVSFGPYSDNECGFVFSLNFDDADLALLHPVRSIKVWGEKPFLARCNPI